MITDYVNRKQRLSKKDPSADFRLADNDDFFGFSKEEGHLTKTQLILAVVIGLPFLWLVVSSLLALTPNI
jgi:hypothetical protein